LRDVGERSKRLSTEFLAGLEALATTIVPSTMVESTAASVTE